MTTSVDPTEATDSDAPAVVDLDTRVRVGCVCAGVGLLAVCGLLMPLPMSSRLSAALGNLVHAPLFMTLTLVGLWAWHTGSAVSEHDARSHWEILRRAALVALAAVLAGMAMEAAQFMGTRSASWHDVVANSWGVLAALVIDVSVRLSRFWHRPRLRWVGGGIAIAALYAASHDSFLVLADVRRVTADFPVLGSFEHRRELTRWYFRNSGRDLSDQHVMHGRHSIELRLRPADVSSMTLTEMHADWSGLQALVLDVTSAADNENPTVRFRVSVIDSLCESGQHQALRKTFWLERGQAQTLRLERADFESGDPARRLDLSRIRYLDLESYPVYSPTRLFIDHIRVEKAPR
ncbi:MAG: hypothetical protein AAF958_17465 [Planctomycetota bacterium]